MNSFRVHATNYLLKFRVPYLLLSSDGNRRIAVDLAHLEADKTCVSPCFTLSEAAIYELLEGRDLHVDAHGEAIDLVPEGSDLVITYSDRSGELRTHKVSLTEIGLGWNLLRGGDAPIKAH